MQFFIVGLCGIVFSIYWVVLNLLKTQREHFIKNISGSVENDSLTAVSQKVQRIDDERFVRNSDWKFWFSSRGSKKTLRFSYNGTEFEMSTKEEEIEWKRRELYYPDWLNTFYRWLFEQPIKIGTKEFKDSESLFWEVESAIQRSRNPLNKIRA